MIKTIFADGTVDIYKGRRDIKAGWKVTTADGRVAMGHSMDVAKAERTARGTATNLSHLYEAYPKGRMGLTAGYIRVRAELAAKLGFKNYDAYAADIKLRRAQFFEGCTIEVVEVTA